MLKPDLLSIAERLAGRDEPALSLDLIAETLGTLPVDSSEIDELFGYLESRGKQVGDAAASGASLGLGPVLASARALRSSLGRAPNAREIAEHSGLSLEAVKRALLFSQIVQR